jgi:hypothetical protein
VCPQILSAATWPRRSSLFLFARDLEGNILSKEIGTEASPSQWEKLGGPYISQPVAMTWNNSLALSVFAIHSDLSTRTRMLSGDNWSGWSNILGQANSALSVCNSKERMDVWVLGPKVGSVDHNFRGADGNFYSPAADKNWDETITLDQAIQGAPGVVCRNSTFGHDMVVYGKNDKSIKLSSFSTATVWTAYVNMGGKFESHPVLLETSDTRFDFFGVGTDSRLYHFASTDAGRTDLRPIGDGFQSVPSAAATGSDRIDVLIVGKDDMLKHRVMKGFDWVGEWEDLGAFAHSAPLVQSFGAQSRHVGLFVVGRNNEINATVWTVDSGISWKGLVWSTVGGNFTTKFFDP